MKNIIRKPAVKGSFYPSQAEELLGLINTFFKRSTVDVRPKIKGLISPHAGYVYSGKTAGIGFSTLDVNNVENIVILSPSHYVSFSGVSIFDGDAYQTPLGDVSIDTEIVRTFRNESSLVKFMPESHDREHGIEVQLPFLKAIYKDKPFSIIPVVFGDKSIQTVNEIVRLILENCNQKKTLIIASSDMSHFYTYDRAREMDLAALDYLEKWDIERLMIKEEEREIELCGFAPVLVLTEVMKQWGCHNIDVLDYCNSGDISGDHSRVVGYSSVVYS